MSDLAIMIDELIEKVTDNFKTISEEITEEMAEEIIKKEYPNGDAPFTAEDLKNEWEGLREMQEQEKQGQLRKKLVAGGFDISDVISINEVKDSIFGCETWELTYVDGGTLLVAFF